MARLIGHFVGHVWAGAVGFAVLSIPAILFSVAAHYLELVPVSQLVSEVFIYGHYTLLTIDVVVFAAYILASVYGAVKELIRYLKGL